MILILKEIIRALLPSKIWCVLAYFYYDLMIINARIKYFFWGNEINNLKEIPIIINNYNRLSSLQRLITSLTKRGYKNIFIIDNNSSYEPLLSYYKETPYPVFRLDRNVGFQALWKTDIFNKFKRSYYVYTDSDMEIDDSCPDDFLQYFYSILKRYPFSLKVGFGLRIDDLPDCFLNKSKVIEWEAQFWKREVSTGIYKAKIDTTFALYRPYCGKSASSYYDAYRTGSPYLIRHLPWYLDSSCMDEEEIYYIESVNQSTHWTVLNKVDV